MGLRAAKTFYVIQEGHHFWRHLGSYRKLEIDAGHVECDIVKHYVAFC